MRRSLLWAPALAYMAGIFYVSSLPNPVPTLIEEAGDKTLHLLAYAGLAFLYGRAIAQERLGWAVALLIAIVAASAYGATDEWHQMYVPGRSSDIRDWFADTGGAAVGACVHAVLAAGWRTKRVPSAAQV